VQSSDLGPAKSRLELQRSTKKITQRLKDSILFVNEDDPVLLIFKWKHSDGDETTFTMDVNVTEPFEKTSGVYEYFTEKQTNGKRLTYEHSSHP
jgi:hypothetical protein